LKTRVEVNNSMSRGVKEESFTRQTFLEEQSTMRKRKDNKNAGPEEQKGLPTSKRRGRPQAGEVSLKNLRGGREGGGEGGHEKKENPS